MEGSTQEVASWDKHRIPTNLRYDHSSDREDQDVKFGEAGMHLYLARVSTTRESVMSNSQCVC